ncbi:class I SAM-dependent methyltransferase [bacterium]|nr:class I SAM-dependent methyltransferase [bacterium]
MATFQDYSHYYQLLYQDKDYPAEVSYLQGLIQKFGQDSKDLLECGCGTGLHAELLEKEGFHVTGIDLSEQMIEEAKKRNLKQSDFSVGDVRNFKLNKTFNIALSLFHVLSYQTADEDIDKMLQSVHSHLEKDGLFIFDYWFAPAVRHLKPSERTKTIENEKLKIVRYAKPDHQEDLHKVDVHYDIEVTNKNTKECFQIKEKHPMRYFDLLEVEGFLKRNGLELLHSEEWLSGNAPSKESWGVCTVAKKIER